jgi:hypothetical protein
VPRTTSFSKGKITTGTHTIIFVLRALALPPCQEILALNTKGNEEVTSTTLADKNDAAVLVESHPCQSSATGSFAVQYNCRKPQSAAMKE